MRAAHERLAIAEQKLRAFRGIIGALAVLGLVVLPNASKAQESYHSSCTTCSSSAQRIAALESKVAELQYRLAHFSRAGDDIYIRGANLHLQNGSGSTGCVNGRGNLIVGYNESRWPSEVNNRRGSHNLVVGAFHNYSSYGGLVAGWHNEIAGAYASVTGGQRNTASGDYTSVTAGRYNVAAGLMAAVSGGAGHKALGVLSSVSGGTSNVASGDRSSVSGGQHNTASAHAASISGGTYNTAGGELSTVSGGCYRSAFGNADWRAGGLFQDQ